MSLFLISLCNLIFMPGAVQHQGLSARSYCPNYLVPIMSRLPVNTEIYIFSRGLGNNKASTAWVGSSLSKAYCYCLNHLSVLTQQQHQKLVHVGSLY